MNCLVHLASGVGNIVLATPLLSALAELGCTTEVCLDADYAETAALLEPWSAVRHVYRWPGDGPPRGARFDAVILAIPPFYARKLDPARRAFGETVRRPPDRLFWQDEQAYYLAFAQALGYPRDRQPSYRLPIGPRADEDRACLGTLVIAPGCKTGRMTAKRWPYFPELAERFADVVIVGTPDDMRQHDGSPMVFAPHVRSFVGKLTLRETAELMAAGGVVVGNDSGLSHVAAATGTSTVMLFGPTADRCLGRLPANVTVMRAGLQCEPCWTTAPLAACGGRLSCLASLTVNLVEREIRCILAGGEAIGDETPVKVGSVAGMDTAG
jgi:ADP-heptose:LPS heptosyltransferase